jgi:hypothetical protein
MEETAIATIPPVKEYIMAEMFPANSAPRSVRTATIIKASTGEYIISAIKENMLESPIFAPGIMSGGNRFSIKKTIKLSAVNMDSVANFFAKEALFFINIII